METVFLDVDDRIMMCTTNKLESICQLSQLRGSLFACKLVLLHTIMCTIIIQKQKNIIEEVEKWAAFPIGAVFAWRRVKPPFEEMSLWEMARLARIGVRRGISDGRECERMCAWWNSPCVGGGCVVACEPLFSGDSVIYCCTTWCGVSVVVRPLLWSSVLVCECAEC